MNIYKSPFPNPEEDSVDIENFQVFSRVEILSLLRSIRDQHVLVTIYFSRGEDFLVTTILAINPEFEEVVMDLGSNESKNERLLASQGLVAVAFIDKIKVQFATNRAESTMHEGQRAIRIRLPDSVLRLQRRGCYRMTTPVARPLKCSIASPDNPQARIEMSVSDLSSSGIAVNVSPEQLSVQPGTVLRDFRLVLDEVGAIECDLQVCYISEASRGSIRRYRLGCSFAGMPGTMTTAIQRYVTMLERERSKRR